MSSSFYDFGRDLLFALPPEQAHNLAIKALSSGYGPRPDIPSDPRLTTTVAGLKFANPLGMAAAVLFTYIENVAERTKKQNGHDDDATV